MEVWCSAMLPHFSYITEDDSNMQYFNKLVYNYAIQSQVWHTTKMCDTEQCMWLYNIMHAP